MLTILLFLEGLLLMIGNWYIEIYMKLSHYRIKRFPKTLDW